LCGVCAVKFGAPHQCHQLGMGVFHMGQQRLAMSAPKGQQRLDR
jgi:hypothetical protein